jgi:hypothetical protein
LVLWEEFGFQSSAKLPYFQFINIGLHLPRPCLWEIAGEACFFRIATPEETATTYPDITIQANPSRRTKISVPQDKNIHPARQKKSSRKPDKSVSQDE